MYIEDSIANVMGVFTFYIIILLLSYSCITIYNNTKRTLWRLVDSLEVVYIKIVLTYINV